MYNQIIIIKFYCLELSFITRSFLHSMVVIGSLSLAIRYGILSSLCGLTSSILTFIFVVFAAPGNVSAG